MHTQFIGISRVSRELKRMAKIVAKESITIVLRGETGVGKEVMARLIHAESDRANRPFVVVNCPAITEALAESELFGHEHGSFTGTRKSTIGLLAEADGGTVFFDEIGDMPNALQLKLLRFLSGGVNGEGREIRRIGKTTTRNVDARIIVATNQDLEGMVADGRFRKDLYYRLGSFHITIPALRERREDVAEICRCFIGERQRFSPEAMDRIMRYSWPGNVRELISVLESAGLRARISDREEVGIEDVVFPGSENSIEEDNGVLLPGFSLKSEMFRWERRWVEMALTQSDGNTVVAAKLLGMRPIDLMERKKKLF